MTAMLQITGNNKPRLWRSKLEGMGSRLQDFDRRFLHMTDKSAASTVSTEEKVRFFDGLSKSARILESIETSRADNSLLMLTILLLKKFTNVFDSSVDDGEDGSFVSVERWSNLFTVENRTLLSFEESSIIFE